MKDSAFSYLEFGTIDTASARKEVWDFRVDQRAYDWLMGARYLNDMLGYLRMTDGVGRLTLSELCAIYASEVHHKNDLFLNFGKLLALGCAAQSGTRPSRRPVSFVELGSTLFGCIEGMRFCQRFLGHHGIKVPACLFEDVQWVGVDNSEMFNQLAPLLHQGYRVHATTDWNELSGDIDVFFAKGVSLLYAIRSLDQLKSLIDRSRLSLFDYSLSVQGEQVATIGTGKQVVYLGLGDFVDLMRRSEKKLYVRRGKSHFSESNGRVFLDLLIGEEALCLNFLRNDTRAWAELKEKIDDDQSARLLLDWEEGEQLEWIPLKEFLVEVGLLGV